MLLRRGLEDQLLASVVGAEQPALEKTKNDLVQVLPGFRLEKRCANLPSSPRTPPPPSAFSSSPGATHPERSSLTGKRVAGERAELTGGVGDFAIRQKHQASAFRLEAPTSAPARLHRKNGDAFDTTSGRP